MTITESAVTIIVVVGFAIWAYSKITRQSIRDTFLEIKELFTRG